MLVSLEEIDKSMGNHLAVKTNKEATIYFIYFVIITRLEEGIFTPVNVLLIQIIYVINI